MVDALTRWVNSLTAAAPKGPEMRKLIREHDKWMEGAQLNTSYWGPDAFYQWQGPEHAPVITRHQHAIFTQRGRDRLYTANGADSLNLWAQWGGIGSVEPHVPPAACGVNIPALSPEYRPFWTHQPV